MEISDPVLDRILHSELCHHLVHHLGVLPSSVIYT